MNQSPLRPHGHRQRLGLAGLFFATIASAASAQAVTEVTSRTEMQAWIAEQVAAAAAAIDGAAAPWIAVFPPLTGGVDKTRIGSSKAGELVVDLIREVMPPVFQNRVLSGADLVAALQVWHWQGGDYRSVSDAELLGAACGCDLTIAGSLETTPRGMRLELVAYRNGVAPDASGRVPVLFKKACEFVRSRKSGDPVFTKAIQDYDSEPVIAFGCNAGAGGGGGLTPRDCESLFPHMLEQLVKGLQHDVGAKGVDWQSRQLGIFPVLRTSDAPVRQFSLRLDQALLTGFPNAFDVGRLHEMLLKQKSSVLWYSTDPIEPGLLDDLAAAHGIGGFVRGYYNYVAGSGRVVVTLEYHDDKCKLVARVRRALVDPRMAGWMDQNLDKDLTDDEAAGYRFTDPTVSVADLQDQLADVARRAIQEAVEKLAKKGVQASARPFFLLPTLLPGTEAQQKQVEMIQQQLAETAARVIKEGAAKGRTEEQSLHELPCTIAGTDFASYHDAYLKLMELVGLNYECSQGQVLRDQFTAALSDQLAESDLPVADQIQMPPSLSQGDFQPGVDTLMVQSQLRLDGDRLTIVVRVIENGQSTRLAQKSVVFAPRLTALIAPQLTQQATDRAVPSLGDFLKAPLQRN
ncbi:MAG: hypothetical protein IT455_10785 [Planctomycetes bacterium]|nr:hypothetical protein [Planctomycetota bacterium]